MLKFIRIFTIFIVLVCSVCGQTKVEKVLTKAEANKKSSVQVQYIANEGVLISTKNKQVLIDGLHRKYREIYAYPPDDLRKKLEGALSPYNNVDLLLVSHLHGDHFHPESIGLHLKNNPKSILASSEQIINEVKKDFVDYEEIKSQIKLVSPEWKKSVEKDFDGVKVKFLGLRHGSERFKWIQNLGHLIEIDGKKFLHVGDADMTEENFSVYKLNEENVDVAFIPYWFLLSENGRKLVKKQFDPKHIIAVHVGTNDGKEVSETLKKHYSDITVFTKILETKSF